MNASKGPLSEARGWARALGYPGGDDFALPASQQRFAAGGAYGIEISSVNDFARLRRLLREADAAGLRIDRVDECQGIFRLPDAEILRMVALCAERHVGLVMSVGPRAIYDKGAFAASRNGARIGYRLRGMENVVHALEDVRRASALGVRGFLIYDEGLMDCLGKLRQAGDLPPATVFKMSVHAGCANPASAALLERLGADSINLVPDLELPMLSAVRQATMCPLDLFSDTALDAGGLIRTYDVPEFIRVAAPVYLKCGAISQVHQNHLPSARELSQRVKQLACVTEMIARHAPSAERVGPEERTLAIPAG